MLDKNNTNILITKSVYDNIRRKFKKYAEKWNGVWLVWTNNYIKPEQYPGQLVSGWKGSKILMNDTVPVEYRDNMYEKSIINPNNQVNVNIEQESTITHTIGNENLLRESLRDLNKKVAKQFGADEYNAAGSSLYYEPIVSYEVVYEVLNTVKEVESSTTYYTKEFEQFTDTKTIQLYSDKNCTQPAMEARIKKWLDGKCYRIRWTGPRFTQRINIDMFNYGVETSWNSKNTSLTQNSGSDFEVYNAELGTNTYQLFNGVSQSVSFRYNISVNNPVIITMTMKNSLLRLTSYTINADNRPWGCEHPKTWTLQASSNNRDWTVVDTRTNISFTQNEAKTFTPTLNGLYKYYRLVITDFNRTTGSNAMELKRITFAGRIPVISIDETKLQPNIMGKTTSVIVGNLGVKKVPDIEATSKWKNKYSYVEQVSIPNKIETNQGKIYLYDINSDWALNNKESGVVQDNLIREEDYKQLERILTKIDKVLARKDGWFDESGLCRRGCQVNCQNRCQVSCQRCNRKQCHNQKCGAH